MKTVMVRDEDHRRLKELALKYDLKLYEVILMLLDREHNDAQ